MVRESPDPTTSIYALMAYYLRFLRLKFKLTQTQVGDIIGVTKGQVSKLELGERQLDSAECRALDRAWDTGDLFTILLNYAKLVVGPNWLKSLFTYQRIAIEHYIFGANVVPLPLQTEDYARSLLQAGRDAGYVENVDKALGDRMKRQAVMLEHHPYLWVVIDEVALRPMGPSSVMADQWGHLLELGRLPHVSIRILPAAATPHIGLDGSFHTFVLPNRRITAFSGSALGVGKLVDDNGEAAQVLQRFHRIAARAWSEDQSRRYIEEMSDRA